MSDAFTFAATLTGQVFGLTFFGAAWVVWTVRHTQDWPFWAAGMLALSPFFLSLFFALALTYE